MDREKALRTGSLIILAVNFILFAYKLILGFFIHSYALISDSFNSLTDAMIGISMIAGVTYAYKPPDEEHAFGHGRAEHVILFILAAILVGTGLSILFGVFIELRNPTTVRYSLFYIVIIALTIPVKFLLGVYASRLGRKHDADFLAADNWHEQSDNLVTAVVIVGIIISAKGYPIVDPLLGAAIAAFLVYLGITYGRKSVTLLMGGQQKSELIEKARNLALKVNGVREVGNIEVHEYGERVIVNITIVLSGNLDASSAHTISHKVQDILTDNGFYSAHTHVDTRRTSLMDEVERSIFSLVSSYTEIKGHHGLEIHESLGTSVAEVHLAFSPGITLEKAHSIAHEIDEKFRVKWPGYKLMTHIEPHRNLNDL